jgi:hypothetical protein
VYRLAVFVFVLLCCFIGISRADSTDVINDFTIIVKDNGHWSKWRSVDEDQIGMAFAFLENKGVSKDSLSVKWTQYVFWPHNDSCVIYSFNHSNMLSLQDTLGMEWMDNNLWRELYDNTEIPTLPVE